MGESRLNLEVICWQGLYGHERYDGLSWSSQSEARGIRNVDMVFPGRIYYGAPNSESLPLSSISTKFESSTAKCAASCAWGYIYTKDLQSWQLIKLTNSIGYMDDSQSKELKQWQKDLLFSPFVLLANLLFFFRCEANRGSDHYPIPRRGHTRWWC